MGADVVVLGLGGMGSAAAAHLAARGARVIGLEQFGPAHDRGSSHGESRIIRQAYFEDPAYVPLLRRAYALYDELDAEDPGLFVRTGGLMLGRPDDVTVTGSLASARHWDLPHELLDAPALRARHPALAVEDDTVALYETAAGFVRPERTVRAHLRRAAAAGADLRFGTPALGWEVRPGGGVRLRTAAGPVEADRLVVTAGAWAPRQLGFDVPLVVERQVLYWFRPADPAPFAPDRFPVFIWALPGGRQLYGFPDLGDGTVKVSFFRLGGPADPDALDRDVHDAEVAVVRAALERHLPGAAGTYVRGLACMYTTTPDEHFVLATHPRHPQVAVGAGFSGHGFKFTPVVGEVLADLALTGTTAHPIDLFDPARLAPVA